MNTLTLKRGGLLIASALILSACGGGGGSDMPGPDAGESKRQSLLYAYPDNGQTEVPTPAPVVLRFSSAVTVDAAEAAITLHEGDANGPTLAATFSTVDGEPRGLVLTPDDKLKPLTDYTVVIRNLKLEKGTAANQVLGFTTRPLHEGPRSLVVSSDDFVIERRIPDGGSSEPVMDFSTFRFQFSQPIDPATVHYGDAPASSTAPADNVGLYDSQGNLVDAVLVVNDRYMTVDPNPQSDDPEDQYFSYLTPGETYTLRLGDGITSVYGETFGGDEIAFTPKDSSPRGEPAVLVQRITDSANRTNLSPLTGKPINEVPVNGVLLGEDANITQASNNAVMAELADVTQYPDVTPIRLPRNTVLDGSSIDVLIGGHVPAGFSSGQVEMRMLSDATGYLVPNPYNSNRSDALRIVHLFMDVAIATEDPRTNGAFTQDILHIELIGTAAVDTTEGVLNIDAVSVVEPNVLGQEYGYGLLSFQLQSYKDQQNPPVDAVAEMEDNEPPVLQSWTLGDNSSTGGVDKITLAKPGDPIVLNFSEPLDTVSLQGRVRLVKNEGGTQSDVPVALHIDGSALVIKPDQPLEQSKELDRISYNISLQSGITDFAGNPFNGVLDRTIELPVQVQQVIGGADNFGNPPVLTQWAPFVLSTYPGYACLIDFSLADLPNDIAGRCAGGFSGVYQEDFPGIPLTEDDLQPEDDYLPVSTIPPNRPIIVRFSKDIDPESVELGRNFIVEEIDTEGTASSEVSGALELNSRVIKFWPDEKWKDGQLYRYTLVSNGDWQSNTCDQQAICGVDGFPLQTRQLPESKINQALVPGQDRGTYITTSATALPNGGGAPFSQIFKGTAESGSVLLSLVNLPTADTNANLFHEMNHTVAETGPNSTGYVPFEYALEEPIPSDEPDPYTDPLLDPDGVRPLPNSAKILTRTPGGKPFGQAQAERMLLNSGTIGCGFNYPQGAELTNDSTGDPLVCPKEKFTYISGGINAEVTSEYVEGRGLKVLIHPGRIMSSSFQVYQILLEQMVPVPSGPQVMRIRYAEDSQGVRNRLVEGWITDDGLGNLELNADVDLYIDAPYLEGNLFGLTAHHNIYSYPVSMNLTGPIEFLDDGRMTIHQFNSKPVPIDMKFYAPVGFQAGFLDLLIPEMGSHLSYVTDPIK
ncbi:hypothetical protein MA04_01994 [Alcanivorax balearicus MACL04]|uniref:SbsA Ig-like domain-containing protein n=1 Tax=Alloalcanivorax balearicus MACL04 TaxID=1177182 RepID=A0ABT2QYU9_9GAMM|nr:Ig-like domain-containing protein [Alloalcanivorax balearicus]MCU5782694.1 hypothetical protein [Alloalcanivorax balearicus MACL04]